MGTGLGHFIPLLAYVGFFAMCVVSLAGRPLYGLYYLIPFVPYRSMRDQFEQWPLGSNLLTLLVIAVIVGALLKHKRPPSSRMYVTWLITAAYLYVSLWIGSAISNAPMPLWLADANFVTWKDYMLLPLLFIAAGLVVEDRKAIKTVILLTGISLLAVDKSAIGETLSRSWTNFDENKRAAGPLVFGVNQLAAYLAQFAMFFWAFALFLQRRLYKVASYCLVGITIITTMYTFSRGAYLALVAAVLVLAIVKDRKLLFGLLLFLATWQSVVPTPVTQRVLMTRDANGVLEASAQERVELWDQSRELFLSSPILGRGYATFQFGEHAANLKDTHNWFVKVLVETGLIGGLLAAVLLCQMLAAGYQLFRKADDPMYKGLGLGFLVAVVACIVANLFGDRWTYIEITGLLWVLAGAVTRARMLVSAPATEEQLQIDRERDEEEDGHPAVGALPPHLGWKY